MRVLATLCGDGSCSLEAAGHILSPGFLEIFKIVFVIHNELDEINHRYDYIFV